LRERVVVVDAGVRVASVGSTIVAIIALTCIQTLYAGVRTWITDVTIRAVTIRETLHAGRVAVSDETRGRARCATEVDVTRADVVFADYADGATRRAGVTDRERGVAPRVLLSFEVVYALYTSTEAITRVSRSTSLGNRVIIILADVGVTRVCSTVISVITLRRVYTLDTSVGTGVTDSAVGAVSIRETLYASRCAISDEASRCTRGAAKVNCARAHVVFADHAKWTTRRVSVTDRERGVTACVLLGDEVIYALHTSAKTVTRVSRSTGLRERVIVVLADVGVTRVSGAVVAIITVGRIKALDASIGAWITDITVGAVAIRETLYAGRLAITYETRGCTRSAAVVGRADRLVIFTGDTHGRLWRSEELEVGELNIIIETWDIWIRILSRISDRGDRDPIAEVRVCAARAITRIALLSEARGEGLRDLSIKDCPRLSIRRALKRPCCGVTLWGVIRRGYAVPLDRLRCVEAELERLRGRVKAEPLGCAVRVKGSLRSFTWWVARVITRDAAEAHLEARLCRLLADRRVDPTSRVLVTRDVIEADYTLS
jgi:hypothetical protein